MGFATLTCTLAGRAAITAGAAAQTADMANIEPGEVRERPNKAVGTGAAERILRRLPPGEVLRVLVLARQSATATRSARRSLARS
jgi:hypothetical protein